MNIANIAPVSACGFKSERIVDNRHVPLGVGMDPCSRSGKMQENRKEKCNNKIHY